MMFRASEPAVKRECDGSKERISGKSRGFSAECFWSALDIWIVRVSAAHFFEKKQEKSSDNLSAAHLFGSVEELHDSPADRPQRLHQQCPIDRPIGSSRSVRCFHSDHLSGPFPGALGRAEVDQNRILFRPWMLCR